MGLAPWVLAAYSTMNRSREHLAWQMALDRAGQGAVTFRQQSDGHGHDTKLEDRPMNYSLPLRTAWVGWIPARNPETTVDISWEPGLHCFLPQEI